MKQGGRLCAAPVSGCVRYHLSVDLPCRIQTGKLSEFLTTSCCAHLSFMDSGKRHEGSSTGEEDDISYFAGGAVHEFQFDDGKDAVAHNADVLGPQSLYQEVDRVFWEADN